MAHKDFNEAWVWLTLRGAPLIPQLCMFGFRVSGVGCRVSDLGFRV